VYFIGILDFSNFGSSVCGSNYSYPNIITTLSHKVCYVLVNFFFNVCSWHCLSCIVLPQVASDESDFEADDKPHDEHVVTLKMVRDLEDKIRNSR
jgi:hypothetical protein